MHIQAGIEISLRVFKRIPNIYEIDSKLVGIDDLIQTNNFTKLSGIMSPLVLPKTGHEAVIPAIRCTVHSIVGNRHKEIECVLSLDYK